MLFHEKYDNHYDWFKHPEKTRDGKGQRLQTMFVYLNDGYEGGSTSFPKIKVRYFFLITNKFYGICQSVWC